LFNPVNNLNNLGSLNAVAFYGLTNIDLVSTSSLSVEVDIQYSYTTFISTIGSTINNIGVSYYFYEPLYTNIINNIFNGAPLVVTISPNPTAAATASSFNLYNSFSISSANAGPTLTVSLTGLVSNANYWLSFNLADSQACSNLVFGKSVLTATGTGGITLNPAYTVPATSSTSGNTYYWSNPYLTCPTSSPITGPTAGTNFEINYRNFILAFTATATTGLLVLAFSSTAYTNTYIIYVSSIIVIQSSSNQIIDWNLEGSSLAAVLSAYTYQSTTNGLTSSLFSYTPVTASTTPSNAIQLSVLNGYPITFTHRSPINLVIGNTYTL
jgi:hypothetical protein